MAFALPRQARLPRLSGLSLLRRALVRLSLSLAACALPLGLTLPLRLALLPVHPGFVAVAMLLALPLSLSLALPPRLALPMRLALPVSLALRPARVLAGGGCDAIAADVVVATVSAAAVLLEAEGLAPLR